MGKHTKPRHNYTQEELDFAIANWDKMKYKDIAAHLGIDADNLKSKIHRLKKKGEDIPNGKELAVGTVTYGTRKGRPVKYTKVKEGERAKCEYLDILKPKPAIKKPAVAINRTMVVKHTPTSNKETYLLQRQESMKKKRGEVRKTKVIDLSICTPVYIKEHNTTVYASPGQDPQEVKQRYEQLMYERRKMIIN